MGRLTGKKGLSNATVGLILAIVLAVASYVAFTKNVPWGGGTEYKVVFNSAQNIRVNSPVRIAGVEVGKVTSVAPLPAGSDSSTAAQTTGPAGTPDPTSAALVTLEIQDNGLPLKEDTSFKLRPRLFLEGNLFVDVFPGSPSAPAQDPSEAFPPSQTSNSVQLDQVLTTLQGDVRKDLQVFLDQFGKALIQGGGAESFRTLYKNSAGSFKSTSQVNEALLGQNTHDLSGLIGNLDKVFRALNTDKSALQDTITNLKTVTGSFAAQDNALEQALVELPQVLDAGTPAFTNLNQAFPPLRALARELLPGTRSAPQTLDAATPLLQQIQLLSRPQELRGLVSDLRPAIPNLAQLSRTTIPFLEQARSLASCFNTVILPWSLDSVSGGPSYDSLHGATGEVYKETPYGLAGISGESRSGDANGQYIRVVGGGGTNTVSTTTPGGDTLAGVTQFPLQGTMPSINDFKKTPFKPKVPCETQEAPNLNAEQGAPPTQSRVATDALPPKSSSAGQILDSSQSIVTQLSEAEQLRQDGDSSQAKPVQKSAERDLQKFYDGKYGG